MRPLILALLVWWSSLALGQGRSLHWSRLEVDATLDRDGRLHVSERQDMVFNGDWNGGERRFRLGMGHKLTLKRISRIDPSGVAYPLRESSQLTAVDDYSWHDRRTLRWRSRLPSDPPFANAEISYLLEYTLENILKPRGDVYLLEHDFAFPERAGVIEQFSLRLQLDEAWKASQEIPSRIDRRSLQPGHSVLLTIPLRYRSSGRPAAVTFGVRREIGWGLAALFLLTVGSLVAGFIRGERARGRFAPLTPAEEIDETWLQENLLRHPPEVVGAAWDERTSASEVAAVLARMTAEGKIRSRVETSGGWLKRNELHLTLLVDRTQLSGYEATLIRALFFAGDQTSTELIRKHYKKKGFDPVAKIRKPVERLAQQLGSSGRAASRPRDKRWRITLLLALTGITLLAATMMLTPQQNLIAAAVALSAIVLFYIIGVVGAEFFASRVTDFGPPAVAIIISVLLLASGVLFLLAFLPSILPLHLLLLVGVPLTALAAVRSTLNWSRIRDDPQRLELRRRFAAARNFFRKQLRERDPRLRDEWFPYLLAFGLGDAVDRWFRAFGVSSTVSSVSSSSSSSSFSRSSGGGWTGGGGAFGGAGSSGSWAVAAGSLAAGVSAPSSGGSGGGGGGGGSSGGGGGGGW